MKIDARGGYAGHARDAAQERARTEVNAAPALFYMTSTKETP